MTKNPRHEKCHSHPFQKICSSAVCQRRWPQAVWLNKGSMWVRGDNMPLAEHENENRSRVICEDKYRCLPSCWAACVLFWKLAPWHMLSQPSILVCMHTQSYNIEVTIAYYLLGHNVSPKPKLPFYYNPNTTGMIAPSLSSYSKRTYLLWPFAV